MNMGKIGLLPLPGAGQELKHDRHGKHVVDLLPADQTDHLGGIVELLQDQRPARVEDRQGRCSKGADVEQRGYDKGFIGTVDSAANHRVDRTEQHIFVRQDRPLGISRGPGGVHDKERIGERRLFPEERFRNGKWGNGIGKEGIVAGSAAVTKTAWHLGPDGLDFRNLGRKVRRIDENPWGAVPKDVCKLRNGQTKIDRRHDRPCLGACKEDLQKLRCVGHQNGHPFTLADPPGDQRMGHPVHTFIKLAVGEGACSLFLQKWPRGRGRRPLKNPFAYVHFVSSRT